MNLWWTAVAVVVVRCRQPSVHTLRLRSSLETVVVVSDASALVRETSWNQRIEIGNKVDAEELVPPRTWRLLSPSALAL